MERSILTTPEPARGVSEMTYTVTSGTLYSTIPYHCADMIHVDKWCHHAQNEIIISPVQCDNPPTAAVHHGSSSYQPSAINHAMFSSLSPSSFSSSSAHTHSVLTAIFPGEHGLAGCPLNSPSPFIPGLHILFGTGLNFPSHS